MLLRVVMYIVPNYLLENPKDRKIKNHTALLFITYRKKLSIPPIKEPGKNGKNHGQQ